MKWNEAIEKTGQLIENGKRPYDMASEYRFLLSGTFNGLVREAGGILDDLAYVEYPGEDKAEDEGLAQDALWEAAGGQVDENWPDLLKWMEGDNDGYMDRAIEEIFNGAWYAGKHSYKAKEDAPTFFTVVQAGQREHLQEVAGEMFAGLSSLVTDEAYEAEADLKATLEDYAEGKDPLTLRMIDEMIATTWLLEEMESFEEEGVEGYVAGALDSRGIYWGTRDPSKGAGRLRLFWKVERFAETHPDVWEALGISEDEKNDRGWFVWLSKSNEKLADRLIVRRGVLTLRTMEEDKRWAALNPETKTQEELFDAAEAAGLHEDYGY